MNITLALLWANASWREAARVGVREVDTEHLYLGLLALGGAAARLLGSHGVTLASARERVRDAQAADLRSLGIDPDPLLLPPRQLREIGHPDLVFTPAARRIVDARHPDTYACLVELLKQADAPRRLLAADGVLPNDLVAELKEGSDDALAAETVPPTPGSFPRRRRPSVSAGSSRPLPDASPTSSPTHSPWPGGPTTPTASRSSTVANRCGSTSAPRRSRSASTSPAAPTAPETTPTRSPGSRR